MIHNNNLQSNIDLSVIIPSYNHKKYIPNLLGSLKQQKTGHNYEVILVDSGNDGTAVLVREDYPWVRLIESDKRLYPGAARNKGIEAARSNLYAFTDTDCTVDVNWIENILSAYKENKSIVVGPILNGTPKSIFGTADYLLECFDFWNAKNGLKIGTVGSGNVFFEKSIFEKYGPLDGFVKGSDSRFFRRTLAAGEIIYWEKNIRIWHHNRTRLGKVLKNQYKLGIGAAKTGKEFNSRATVMMNHPYLMPFIPILRFIRIGWILLRKSPANFIVYILLFPLILLGLTVHATGFVKEAFNKEN